MDTSCRAAVRAYSNYNRNNPGLLEPLTIRSIWTYLQTALVAAAVLAAGCGRSSGRTELSVFAASSLTEAFETIESDFEAHHPAIDVRLTFAGSQVLRLQIEQGAHAEVFASADPDHMNALITAGLAGQPHTFAHNELVVIVPPDSSIRTFADLDDAARIVVGEPSVPVGRYTEHMLERAGATTVRERIVSREPNVRLVRAKVELGEADAAVVYRTDVINTSDVRTIEIPAEVNVRADYAIGITTRAPPPSPAARFVDFVLSPPGQAALRRRGFVTEES